MYFNIRILHIGMNYSIFFKPIWARCAVEMAAIHALPAIGTYGIRRLARDLLLGCASARSAWQYVETEFAGMEIRSGSR